MTPTDNEKQRRPGLSITEVAIRYELTSAQAIRNQVSQGNFPPPDIRRGSRYVRWTKRYLKAYEANVASKSRLSAPRFAQQWQANLTGDELEFTDPHCGVLKQITRLLKKVKSRKPRQGRQPGPRTAAGRHEGVR